MPLHRFHDLFSRDEFSASGSLVLGLSNQDLKDVCEVLVTNPLVNNQAFLSLIQRYALDWTRPDASNSLFKTSMPFFLLGVPTSKSLKNDVYKLVQTETIENSRRHRSAQLDLERFDTYDAHEYFLNSLIAKPNPEFINQVDLCLSRHIDDHNLCLIENGNDRFAIQKESLPYSERFKLSIEDRAPWLMIEAKRDAAKIVYAPLIEERNQNIATLKSTAYGQLDQKSWHQILQECLQRDVVPAFLKWGKFENPSLHTKVAFYADGFTASVVTKDPSAQLSPVVQGADGSTESSLDGGLDVEEAFPDEEETYDVQYAPGRDAVWVHCSDGSTVGRFGKMGVDIHHSASDQMNGSPECLICTHGKPTQEDWNFFRAKSTELWGVNIPSNAFDPRFFKPSQVTPTVDDPQSLIKGSDNPSSRSMEL